jgi:hypothetical protein
MGWAVAWEVHEDAPLREVGVRRHRRPAPSGEVGVTASCCGSASTTASTAAYWRKERLHELLMEKTTEFKHFG